MDRALVVVEATEATKQLLREAGELAEGVEAEIILVHVTTEEQYADRADALANIPDVDVSYDVTQARDGAGQFARDIGNEVLADLDVEFSAIGRLGDKVEEVLAVADEYGCDHLFVTGRQRSPTGKAIFGDRAQALILNFAGPVTVTTVAAGDNS